MILLGIRKFFPPKKLGADRLDIHAILGCISTLHVGRVEGLHLKNKRCMSALEKRLTFFGQKIGENNVSSSQHFFPIIVRALLVGW